MKIEIDVTEKMYKELKSIQTDLLEGTVRYQAIKAYEAKLPPTPEYKQGNWYLFEDYDGKKDRITRIVFKFNCTAPDGLVDYNGKHYPPEQCRRLSDSVQRLLLVEVG